MINHYIPVSDDYMRYDELTGQYVLTEKDLVEHMGLDLRSRMANDITVDAATVINYYTERASDLTYLFMSEHSLCDWQKEAIKCVPKARLIIRKAMEAQLLYIVNVGDLTLSTKAEERTNYMDVAAVKWLNTFIPELGRTLLYSGV